MWPNHHFIRKATLWVCLCLHDRNGNVNYGQRMTEIIENLSDYFMRCLLLFCFAEEMRGGETTLSHSKWKLDNMYLKDCIIDVLIKICATRCKDNRMTVLYRWWTWIRRYRNSQCLQHFWSRHHIYSQHISVSSVMKSGHDPNILCIFQIKWKNVFLPPQSQHRPL